jgi:hypothetical protein
MMRQISGNAWVYVLGMTIGLTTGAQSVSGAPITFTAFDRHGNSAVPLGATPNADAARDAFLAGLVGVGTETFENIPIGTRAPLTVSFEGAGSATLLGPGRVVSVTPGEVLRRGSDGSPLGRYSVPSTSTSRFWDTAAQDGGFAIEFGSPVAAFGFYAVDVGESGGILKLLLEASGGGTVELSVPLVSPARDAEGSVLFFGFIDTETLYDRIAFVTRDPTSGASIDDGFGFDNFIIGSIEQVRTDPPEEFPPHSPPTAVPTPGALSLFSVGLFALGLLRVRAVSKRGKVEVR